MRLVPPSHHLLCVLALSSWSPRRTVHIQWASVFFLLHLYLFWHCMCVAGMHAKKESRLFVFELLVPEQSLTICCGATDATVKRNPRISSNGTDASLGRGRRQGCLTLSGRMGADWASIAPPAPWQLQLRGPQPHARVTHEKPPRRRRCGHFASGVRRPRERHMIWAIRALPPSPATAGLLVRPATADTGGFPSSSSTNRPAGHRHPTPPRAPAVVATKGAGGGDAHTVSPPPYIPALTAPIPPAPLNRKNVTATRPHDRNTL